MSSLKIPVVINRLKPLCLLLPLCCLLLAACQPVGRDKLTIAVAANMQFAMKELTAEFTGETGISCETVISSSGKFTAQIREGAPYDVFVSADMKYPSGLFREGHTTASPETYAYGRLVIWSMIDSLTPSVALLNTDKITHIALANPRTAPYGLASVEVLKYYNIYEKVENKLVYGESIAQTNHFIISKAAEAGFTSLSVVRSPEMQGKGSWKELDPKTYSPITQGVVVLKNRPQMQDEAQKFYNFLFSKKGKHILDQFGYRVKND